MLAALRPKMLALAAERCAGAHPYFVPPEHTARAREILGKGKILAPEQKVLLGTDAAKARAVARAAMKIYARAPELPEQPEVARLHATPTSPAAAATASSTRSSRGATRGAIRERIQAHYDAGADHVCIQPLHPDGLPMPDEKVLELLAPAKS